MTDSLLHQIKERRLKLGLKQKDMMMRIGVSRQQYQLRRLGRGTKPNKTPIYTAG